MKEKKIEWLYAPGNIASGDSIRCLIDGILVEGTVVFDAKNMMVTLARPNRGKSECSHIWNQAPQIYTERPLPDSALNKEGLENAKEMLIRIYSTS